MNKRPAIITLACIAAATSLLSGAAFAQSSLSGNKEVTTADAAVKLQQSTDGTLNPDLSKNGVDTQTEDPSLGVGEEKPVSIDPYAAEGGPLTLLNCSAGGIKVKTYNSSDKLMWAAYQEKSIASGSSGGLKCATDTCKLKVNSGAATVPISGYRVYIAGTVKATNKAAIAQGCAIY